jgi:hypothetical protein
MNGNTGWCSRASCRRRCRAHPGDDDERQRFGGGVAAFAVVPPRHDHAVVLDASNPCILGLANAARQSNVIVFAMKSRGLAGAAAVPARGDATLWASYQAALLTILPAICEPIPISCMRRGPENATVVRRLK